MKPWSCFIPSKELLETIPYSFVDGISIENVRDRIGEILFGFLHSIADGIDVGACYFLTTEHGEINPIFGKGILFRIRIFPDREADFLGILARELTELAKQETFSSDRMRLECIDGRAAVRHIGML